MKVTRGTWVCVTVNGKVKFIPKDKYQRSYSARGVQIIPDIQPYRNVIDGKVIAGRRQHREFLKQHGVVEVGNEKPKAPQQQQGRDYGLVQDIKRAMGRL